MERKAVRRLPPLSSLPAFEATARLGSVKAAAEELGRTHGAVSKQIRHLAEDLGVALFEKQGVGLRPTRAGQELLGEIGAALDRIDGACGALRRGAQEDVVEIGVSATLAMRWLVPRLPRFYCLHPNIDIHLQMAGHGWRPDGAIDAVLSVDPLSRRHDNGPARRVLGDVAWGVTKAPTYPLTRKSGAAVFEARVMAEGMAEIAWSKWAALADLDVREEKSTRFPNTFLAIEAAVAGLGVCLCEERLVAQDVEAGRLVAPFGFVPIRDGFIALVSDRGRGRGSALAFLDWLETEAKDAAA